jgi:hypothetical protein
MNLFKVTRALPGDSLSAQFKAPNGSLPGAVVGRRGQMVQIDGATAAGKPGVFNSDVAWKLANNTRGFHLERDVIVGPIPFEQLLFLKDFLIADIVNQDSLIGYASARKVQEFEAEGPDLIDAGVDGATAVGTALTSKAGKIGLKGANDELYGYLRGQLAAQDAGNAFRILVEVVE